MMLPSLGRWLRAAASLLAAILSVAAADASAPPGQAAPEVRLPLAVTVTLSDIEPIVRAVGGDLVSSFVVMPSGGDPHSYSISAEVVRRAQDADLIVYTDTRNLAFEAHLRTNLPGVPAVDWPDYARHGARLFDCAGMPQNPHGYWLNFGNGRAIAIAVAEALVAHGAPREAIEANLRRFVEELDVARATGLALAEEAGLAGDTLIIAAPGIADIVGNLGMVPVNILVSEGGGFVSAAALDDVMRQLKRGTARAIACPGNLREAKAGDVARQLSEDTGRPIIWVRFLAGASGSYLSQAYYNAAVLTCPTTAVRAATASSQGWTTPYVAAIAALAAVVIAQAAYLLRRRTRNDGISGHGMFDEDQASTT